MNRYHVDYYNDPTLRKKIVVFSLDRQITKEDVKNFKKKMSKYKGIIPYAATIDTITNGDGLQPGKLFAHAETGKYEVVIGIDLTYISQNLIESFINDLLESSKDFEVSLSVKALLRFQSVNSALSTELKKKKNILSNEEKGHSSTARSYQALTKCKGSLGNRDYNHCGLIYYYTEGNDEYFFVRLPNDFKYSDMQKIANEIKTKCIINGNGYTRALTMYVEINGYSISNMKALLNAIVALVPKNVDATLAFSALNQLEKRELQDASNASNRKRLRSTVERSVDNSDVEEPAFKRFQPN